MKVWWCAQQESTVPWGLRECVRADDRETRTPGHEKCGPMRLIPDNEETVELMVQAIARNQWGTVPVPDRDFTAFQTDVTAILDALDGETP